jgi:hypothetical protein
MGDALAKLFEVASCRFLCVDGSPPAGRGKAAVKLAPPARLQPCLSESHQLHLGLSLISRRTSGLFSCWSTRTRVVPPLPLCVPGARKFHNCTGAASMHSAAQQPGKLNLPAEQREFQRDDRRHLYRTTTVGTEILQLYTSKAAPVNCFSLFCHLEILFWPLHYHYRGRIANPATLEPPALQGLRAPQGVKVSFLSDQPCSRTRRESSLRFSASINDSSGKAATSPDGSWR